MPARHTSAFVPTELREALEESARGAHDRSLSAELRCAIRSYVGDSGRPGRLVAQQPGSAMERRPTRLGIVGAWRIAATRPTLATASARGGPTGSAHVLDPRAALPPRRHRPPHPPQLPAQASTRPMQLSRRRQDRSREPPSHPQARPQQRRTDRLPRARRPGAGGENRGAPRPDHPPPERPNVAERANAGGPLTNPLSWGEISCGTDTSRSGELPRAGGSLPVGPLKKWSDQASPVQAARTT